MTTKQERSDAHWKKKEILKREIDAEHSEVFGEVLVRVSFGFGLDNDVMNASSEYMADNFDILRLKRAHLTKKWIPIKEERPGFVGTYCYQRSKYIMEFHVINDALREEVAELYSEENWSELEKIFGGN